MISSVMLKFFLSSAFQVLPKEDVETLNLCRSMMERGEWPPLMVVFDPREGYVNLHGPIFFSIF